MNVKGSAAVVLFAVILSAGVAAKADTIYVPGDYPTIADAVAAAYTNDRIVATSSAFNNEPSIDWLGKAIRVESQGNINQSDSGIYRLGVGGTLAGPMGGYMQLNGELRSPEQGTGYVDCYDLSMGYNSRIVARPGASLYISAHNAYTEGSLTIQANASLTAAMAAGQSFGCYDNITLAENAALQVTGSLSSRRLTAAAGAVISGGSSIYVDESMIVNGGAVSTAYEFIVDYYANANLYESDLSAAYRCINRDEMQMWGGMIMTISLDNHGDLELLDTTISAENFTTQSYAATLGAGMWMTDVENYGALGIIDDTTIIGDVENTGDIRIYDGSLTILGALENNGTIVGNLARDDGAVDVEASTFRVGDDFIAEMDSEMYFPSPDWRVRIDGDYENYISDHLAFDLSQATLTLGALAGANVTCEVMSRDIGPSPAGLDRTYPGHYPLGTLHLAGATVNLADAWDNDGMGDELGEAIYVDTLLIDAGATLNTDGYRVYYNTLINNGYVSEPENLIKIGSGQPGDLDGDGDVDLADLADLLGRYGSCRGEDIYNPAADFDFSGCIDLSDLAFLLGYYGS